MANLGDIAQQALQAGFDLPPEKKFYVNGFAMGGSPADVVLVLEGNGQPVAVVNMSYEVAKSIVARLGSLLKSVEESTGQRILTPEEIAPVLSNKESG